MKRSDRVRARREPNYVGSSMWLLLAVALFAAVLLRGLYGDLGAGVRWWLVEQFSKLFGV